MQWPTLELIFEKVVSSVSEKKGHRIFGGWQ
jgi:hypothetical protein